MPVINEYPASGGAYRLARIYLFMIWGAVIWYVVPVYGIIGFGIFLCGAAMAIRGHYKKYDQNDAVLKSHHDWQIKSLRYGSIGFIAMIILRYGGLLLLGLGRLSPQFTEITTGQGRWIELSLEIAPVPTVFVFVIYHAPPFILTVWWLLRCGQGYYRLHKKRRA